MSEEKIKATCSQCGTSMEIKPTKKGNIRTPSGWHKTDGELTCRDCWRGDYVLRAVTFPIVGPVDGSWADLREELAKAWHRSTCLANWAMRQVVVHDVTRKPNEVNMPKRQPFYLYGFAKQNYAGWSSWQGGSCSAQSIFRTIDKKWSRVRYDVLWRESEAIPTYKYPYPYPLHSDSWRADYSPDGHEPLITFPLGDRRWTLRLKGGQLMRRQLKAFAQIVSGAARQGEMALYRLRANAGDNRSGGGEAGSGPAPRSEYRYMAKLVAWLPRGAAQDAEGTLEFKTDKEHFLVAPEVKFILNADDTRQWIINHWIYLQRIAEDTKYEKRWPKRKRQAINAARQLRCEKYHNRITTRCKQIAAMLVGVAKRKHYEAIRLDLTDREYFGDAFQWSFFQTAVQNAAEMAGLHLEVVGGSAPQG